MIGALDKLAYNSGRDALRELIVLQEYGGQISNTPKGMLLRPNGIPYYFVEVTCKDGDTYVIEAYGEEATELYNECSGIDGVKVATSV